MPGQPLSLKASDLISTLVRLKIADENRDGRTTSKLQSVLPHPDGAGTKAKSRSFVPGPSVDEDDEEDIGEEETPLLATARREVRGAKPGAIPLDDEDEEQFEDEDPRSDDEEEEVAPPKAKRGRKPAAVVEQDEEDEVPEPVRRRGPAVVERPVNRKSRL